MRVLTAEENAEVVRRYSKGQSLREIQFATDFPMRCVREAVIAVGLLRPVGGRNPGSARWRVGAIRSGP